MFLTSLYTRCGPFEYEAMLRISSVRETVRGHGERTVPSPDGDGGNIQLYMCAERLSQLTCVSAGNNWDARMKSLPSFLILAWR
jgi:hypothetical protein